MPLCASFSFVRQISQVFLVSLIFLKQSTPRLFRLKRDKYLPYYWIEYHGTKMLARQMLQVFASIWLILQKGLQ